MHRKARTRYAAQTLDSLSIPLKTITLGTLIEAIREEADSGDDRLVAEIVLHLLDTGQITPVGQAGESAAEFGVALSDDPLK